MVGKSLGRGLAIVLTLSIVLSAIPAGVVASDHGEEVGAKQIVFVSGDQFLADGELDEDELGVLDDAVLVVPGGGVAYGDVRATPATAAQVEFLLPYFDDDSVDAHGIAFLSPSFGQEGDLREGERALLRDAVVMVPHTKFTVNGDRAGLTKAEFVMAGNPDVAVVLYLRDDEMPGWFDAVTITGFGTFVTNPDNMAPGRATDELAAKQIVFVSGSAIAADGEISERELASIQDAYVVAPAGTYEEAQSIGRIRGTWFPHLTFAGADLEAVPAIVVFDAGPVGKYEYWNLRHSVVVAPTTELVVDDETASVTRRAVTVQTVGEPVLTIGTVDGDALPAWVDDTNGALVTDSDNMVTDPDNMVEDGADPFYLAPGAGSVWVMPGDNTGFSDPSQGHTGAYLIDGGPSDEAAANTVAVFPGDTKTFLKAKKAFDAAAETDDDVVLDPGDEVVTDPDNMAPILNPGADRSSVALTDGKLWVTADDRTFATRVRKAFVGQDDYGFVVVKPAEDHVGFGYVSGDSLVTDTLDMPAETALPILETAVGEDSETRP